MFRAEPLGDMVATVGLNPDGGFCLSGWKITKDDGSAFDGTEDLNKSLIAVIDYLREKALSL